MRRGELAFDKLKELALYKMNLPENVAKGWPSEKEYTSYEGYSDQQDYLKHAIIANYWMLQDEMNELGIEIERDEDYSKAKLEIADVAAFCAILLDLIEQLEQEK